MTEDFSDAADSPKPKIFVALPNMVWSVSKQILKLFHIAQQEGFMLMIEEFAELRHHDYGRNCTVKAFLKSGADYLMTLDADVDPHPDILQLSLLGKQIIAANVFCWMQGKLLPSIWTCSDCEECRVLDIYKRTGKVHDSRGYQEYDVMGKKVLERWNPFRQRYEDFYSKDFGFEKECRCKRRGWAPAWDKERQTSYNCGRDPWVYTCCNDVWKKPTELLKVDSVGGAATFYHRSVFEAVPFPWFSFLYRENREIMLTEDHYLCWQAREAGIDIWAHPQYFCSHYKTMDLIQVNHALVESQRIGADLERKKYEKEEKESSRIVIPGVVPRFAK